MKNQSKKEKELLDSLNSRAANLLKIEAQFRGKKVPIDLEYLDSLSDEKLQEIVNNHCNEEREYRIEKFYEDGTEQIETIKTSNLEWFMEQYQRNRPALTWGIIDI